MRKYFRTVKCTLNMPSWSKKREVITIYKWIEKELDNGSYKGVYSAEKTELENKIIEAVRTFPEIMFVESRWIQDPFQKMSQGIWNLALRNDMVNLLVELAKPEYYRVKLPDDDHVYSNYYESINILIRYLGNKIDALKIEEQNLLANTIFNALKDDDILLYQREDYGNLAVNHASFMKKTDVLDPVFKTYLNHPIASLQQGYYGQYNLGMLCAKYKRQDLFNLAYQNPVAREQKNIDGYTMIDVALENGLTIPTLTDDEGCEE